MCEGEFVNWFPLLQQGLKLDENHRTDSHDDSYIMFMCEIQLMSLNHVVIVGTDDEFESSKFNLDKIKLLL